MQFHCQAETPNAPHQYDDSEHHHTGSHIVSVLLTAQPKLVNSHPHLFKELDPSNARFVELQSITAGSSRDLIWKCNKCPCGQPHVWQASIMLACMKYHLHASQ